MEASLKPPRTAEEAPRKLDGEKARRIVAAMRASMGTRGAAGSTFDHVAREAGVSRGLLHYYFGSKERLLVEVVRHDCEVRIRALEQRLSAAKSLDEIVEVLVTQLEAFVADDPGSQAVLYELLSASRHSEEIQSEMAELYRRWRAHLADALRQKEREGVVELRGDAESVAAVLFALGDGLGLQLISDPDWDSRPSLEVGMRTARHLLGASARA
jgi:AcrR family transcriptional regulator